MLTRNSLSALATLPLAFVLSANMDAVQPAEVATYSLALEITDNGQLIGQPRLGVGSGETAVVHIEPGDGRSYKLSMTLTGTADERVTVTSQVEATSPTLGSVSFAPVLTVRSGEVARIEYGNEAPGVEPLKIAFTVTE